MTQICYQEQRAGLYVEATHAHFFFLRNKFHATVQLHVTFCKSYRHFYFVTFVGRLQEAQVGSSCRVWRRRIDGERRWREQFVFFEVDFSRVEPFLHATRMMQAPNGSSPLSFSSFVCYYGWHFSFSLFLDGSFFSFWSWSIWSVRFWSELLPPYMFPIHFRPLNCKSCSVAVRSCAYRGNLSSIAFGFRCCDLTRVV